MIDGGANDGERAGAAGSILGSTAERSDGVLVIIFGAVGDIVIDCSIVVEGIGVVSLNIADASDGAIDSDGTTVAPGNVVVP